MISIPDDKSIKCPMLLEFTLILILNIFIFASFTSNIKTRKETKIGKHDQSLGLIKFHERLRQMRHIEKTIAGRN